MPHRDGFLEFVLDQLGNIDEVVPRRMFGGVGLYAGGVFFGIMFQDILYLKVDDTTRGDYERARMKPFKPYADRPITMQYYEVPASVLESADDLTEWARRAIEVSTKRATKGTKNSTNTTKNTKTSTKATKNTKGTKDAKTTRRVQRK